MAKHTVTHSCGHEQTHALFGRRRDRDAKLEWLADALCSDCFRAQQDERRTAASEAAAAKAEHVGLPKLEGTERQIAWAETVRAGFCGDVLRWEAQMAASVRASGIAELLPHAEQLAENTDPLGGARRVLADRMQETCAYEQGQRAALACAEQVAAIDRVLARTSAHWWIEVRGHLSIGGLPRLLADEAAAAEAARAAELRQEQLWREKDEIAARAHDFLGDLVTCVEVWNKGDKRVYLGHGFGASVADYYSTGNHRKRPGSLDLTAAAKKRLGERAEEFKAWLSALCGRWNALKLAVSPEGKAS